MGKKLKSAIQSLIKMSLICFRKNTPKGWIVVSKTCSEDCFSKFSSVSASAKTGLIVSLDYLEQQNFFRLLINF